MLYVSEPNPFMFGNANNDPKWKEEVTPWGENSANWLKSRFHFSFAEYRNMKNSKFGVLRVMNDDFVQPDRGFGAHPHSNMEIVTYVVQGKLWHKDNHGNSESLPRGSVQFMSAGTGVVHSEANTDKELPVRFIQMWVPPRVMGADVNYGSLLGDFDARHNKWQHLVSDCDSSFKTPIKILQDANFYVSELDKGVSLDFQLAENRQAYFLCIEGDVDLVGANAAGTEESSSLKMHDGAELFGDLKLKIEAKTTSHVLIVEMEKNGDSRFK